MTSSDVTAPRSLRVLLVPGSTPGRWVRTWTERRPKTPVALVQVEATEALDRLRAGDADIGLVRMTSRPDDVAGFRLYEEATVAVVPRDHVLAAAEDVTLAEVRELAEPGRLLVPADDVLGLRPDPDAVVPATTAEAVELVAAGLGALVVPQSLARLHDRRDLTYRTVTDAPSSAIWLAWPADGTTEDVELFVGIVRGRTANSSRNATPTPDPTPGRTRPPARQPPRPRRPTGRPRRRPR